jgi:hypothetical protein
MHGLAGEVANPTSDRFPLVIEAMNHLKVRSCLIDGEVCCCAERGLARFDRMIVKFTMLNQGKVIPCAISTAAMDDLEGRRDVRPDQRVDRFMRLREC